MTFQLPTDGGDDGLWGQILNTTLTWLRNQVQSVSSSVSALASTVAGKVDSTDPRLSDARPPTSHTHTVADLDALGVAGDTTFLRGDGRWATPPGGGGGGVTAHSELTGLDADDHPQYLNQARGDARYYTQGQVDAALGGKANTSHGHVIADVTGLQDELDGKQASGDYATTEDLSSGLAGKADSAHSHTIEQVTGLDATLVAVAGMAQDAQILAENLVLTWSGSFWPTRNLPEGFTAIWVSAADPAAPQPSGMELGDIWVKHPDAV